MIACRSLMQCAPGEPQRACHRLPQRPALDSGDVRAEHGAGLRAGSISRGFTAVVRTPNLHDRWRASCRRETCDGVLGRVVLREEGCGDGALRHAQSDSGS